ncbi:MAG TPA: class IV adenylate cyclase [Bryobacteraceae bacterium]|nr:class IV adenylate cyclase [Bryobacteraceae bacterium]
MASAEGRETEIKLAMKDAASARALLRRAGFRIHRRRVFESNTCFDSPQRTLRAAGELLRVRKAGRRATLTYKGRPDPDAKHKSREEIEVALPEAEAISAIIDRLGFWPIFRYEKYRTEYRQASGEGIATLDETPIGVYVELEGAPEWIDRAAAVMGFAEADYITMSYAGLYVNWSRDRGETPTNMLFGAGTGGAPRS